MCRRTAQGQGFPPPESVNAKTVPAGAARTRAYVRTAGLNSLFCLSPAASATPFGGNRLTERSEAETLRLIRQLQPRPAAGRWPRACGV